MVRRGEVMLLTGESLVGMIGFKDSQEKWLFVDQASLWDLNDTDEPTDDGDGSIEHGSFSVPMTSVKYVHWSGP